MEFSTPSISNNVSNRGLNDLERAKLNELLVANIVLLPPLEEDITNLSDDCDLKVSYKILYFILYIVFNLKFVSG